MGEDLQKDLALAERADEVAPSASIQAKEDKANRIFARAMKKLQQREQLRESASRRNQRIGISWTVLIYSGLVTAVSLGMILASGTLNSNFILPDKVAVAVLGFAGVHGIGLAAAVVKGLLK